MQGLGVQRKVFSILDTPLKSMMLTKPTIIDDCSRSKMESLQGNDKTVRTGWSLD